MNGQLVTWLNYAYNSILLSINNYYDYISYHIKFMLMYVKAA